jgi:hypothetical protein
LLYTVRAEAQTSEAINRLIDWLATGHISEVIEAGALSGRVVRTSPLTAEVQYIFANDTAFASYEADHAPRLRQHGLALFGPDTVSPVRFTRAIGSVVFEAGG